MTYAPVNIAQALQNLNNQLDMGFNQINQRLDEVLALSHNNRILARNRHHAVPQDYLPLYKTVRCLTVSSGLRLTCCLSRFLAMESI